MGHGSDDGARHVCEKKSAHFFRGTYASAFLEVYMGVTHLYMGWQVPLSSVAPWCLHWVGCEMLRTCQDLGVRVRKELSFGDAEEPLPSQRMPQIQPLVKEHMEEEEEEEEEEDSPPPKPTPLRQVV